MTDMMRLLPNRLLAGCVAALSTLCVITAVGEASATPEAKECTARAYSAGSCLVGLQLPGVSPLTSAVQAAIRSGRGDVVDKFSRRLPSNDAGNAQRREIEAARKSVSNTVYVSPESGEGSINRAPKPGTISPRGGNDGTANGYVWTLHKEYPIVRIVSGGGTVTLDTIDIDFRLDLYTLNTAQLSQEFEARNGIGTFGVKDFTCQVKMDRPILPDPVRGSFSGCIGSPKTTHLGPIDSQVSHNYYNEPNWVHIRFESYDGEKGVSFGTFEYKSQNWTKNGSGDQYF